MPVPRGCLVVLGVRHRASTAGCHTRLAPSPHAPQGRCTWPRQPWSHLDTPGGAWATKIHLAAQTSLPAYFAQQESSCPSRRFVALWLGDLAATPEGATRPEMSAAILATAPRHFALSGLSKWPCPYLVA